MPEFAVELRTVRSATRIVQIVADDANAARQLVQAECDAGLCHCPPEWCTDDVESEVLHVRRITLDDSTNLAAE